MAESCLRVEVDHLCVISDLHLGNPIFFKNHSLSHFLRHLSRNGISLCVNGDGMDLLQVSIPKFAKEILATFKTLKDFILNGDNEIFYLMGNHDILVRPFLEESGLFPVASSLEVISGNKRIYIEHGHSHDYLFQNYQKIYIRVAQFLGKLLKVCPELFHVYFKIEWFIDWLVYGLKNRKFRQLLGSKEDCQKYLQAARQILSRGFDIVIFGHSHRHGLHVMEDGKIYANAGTWTTRRSHFLEILKGNIRLREWR
jgi:UDP-2,3-diacylglucosamine pyrophosphatase LpxH